MDASVDAAHKNTVIPSICPPYNSTIQVPRHLPLFNATILYFTKKSINSTVMGTAIIPLNMPGPVGPTTWILFLLVSQIQNLARLFQKFSNAHKFFLRNKSENLSKGAWNNSFFNIAKATKVQLMATPESSEQAGGWFPKPYELFSTVKYST